MRKILSSRSLIEFDFPLFAMIAFLGIFLPSILSNTLTLGGGASTILFAILLGMVPAFLQWGWEKFPSRSSLPAKLLIISISALLGFSGSLEILNMFFPDWPNGDISKREFAIFYAFLLTYIGVWIPPFNYFYVCYATRGK